MIFERVKQLAVSEMGVDGDKITLTTSLKDMGLDSLDAIELIMAIEEEYSIEISEEDARQMETMENIVAYIEKHQ